MAKRKIFIIEKLMFLLGFLGCLAVPYVIFGGLFGFLETSHFFICVVLFVCVFFVDKWRAKLLKLWVTESEILEWREMRNNQLNGHPFETKVITFTGGTPAVLTYSSMTLNHKKLDTLVMLNDEYLFLILDSDVQIPFNNKLNDCKFIAHVIAIDSVKKFYIDGQIDASYETKYNSITNAYDTSKKTKDNRKLIMIADDVNAGLTYSYEFDINCLGDFRRLFPELI